jgi:phage tail sheath protein FI
VLQATTPNAKAVPPTEPRPAFSDADAREGQQALLRSCARMKDRFAIFDVPEGMSPDQAVAWADDLRAEAGQYAAVYYPWLVVPDLQQVGVVRRLPPSGHITGMAAGVDRRIGVHKPPANERLEDVYGMEREVDAPVHGQLNDAAVNVIRAFPGRGLRAAGTRTLTDADHAEWLFVNVRRLFLMIEASIEQSSQWAAFEPNRPDRWRELDRVVRYFLDDLWRGGQLDGATADEAYYVQCDDATNPPDQIDAGRMTCLIGAQPPRPAEFVIVRLGRTVNPTPS